MTDGSFTLNTGTIIEDESLVHLSEQVKRLEIAVNAEDSPLILDTSKALLESVLKTILNDHGVEFESKRKNNRKNLTIIKLCTLIRNNLRLANSEELGTEIGVLLGNIVRTTAELRNNYGEASHGKDALFDNPLGFPEAKMIASLADNVSCFLLSRNAQLRDPANGQRIYYLDNEEFNDFLDLENDPINLKISDSGPIPYSKALFGLDPEAYKESLLQFLDNKEDI
ncbi:abortive infection family protein [Maridesulfovibrio sp.]|uniref:abortive infection family protein n=1 Tax=Maridesulfovibrio sp. TaxID=2795000 RepID=UPI003BABED79